MPLPSTQTQTGNGVPLYVLMTDMDQQVRKDIRDTKELIIILYGVVIMLL